MTRYLENSDYSVRAAASLSEAYGFLKDEAFDVAVVDRTSGMRELCEWVRRLIAPWAILPDNRRHVNLR